MEVILKCIGIMLTWLISMSVVGILLSLFSIQGTEISIIVSQIIMLLLVVLLKRKGKIVFHNKVKGSAIFVMGAVLTGIGAALLTPLNVTPLGLSGRFGMKAAPADFTALLMILELTAAVVEELLFRGIIMNLCKTRFNAGKAIFIAALIFAVGHGSPIMWVNAFVVGLLCGYYYHYSGRIMIPIIIHLVNNFIWGCFMPVLMILQGNSPAMGTNGTAEWTGSLAELLPSIMVPAIIGIVIIAAAAVLVYKFGVRRQDVSNNRG